MPAIALCDGGHPDIVKEGGELFEDAEQIPELIEKIVANYDVYQKRISVLNLYKVVEQYYKFIFQINTDKESCRYKPKSLGVYSGARLKSALLWWQGCEIIRGKLARVKSAVSNILSRKR